MKYREIKKNQLFYFKNCRIVYIKKGKYTFVPFGAFGVFVEENLERECVLLGFPNKINLTA